MLREVDSLPTLTYVEKRDSHLPVHQAFLIGVTGRVDVRLEASPAHPVDSPNICNGGSWVIVDLIGGSHPICPLRIYSGRSRVGGGLIGGPILSVQYNFNWGKQGE